MLSYLYVMNMYRIVNLLFSDLLLRKDKRTFTLHGRRGV